ncbi:Protein SERAC1 [Lachnellula subtilissima]|uniref:Protein SERAC1 n=1 Tax=Lachnellula subtilissima TaxID=602034 RepID=A0A8H8RER0_9HELO|nr:Protein SERAC1 [Lachnellula subtilissima]
MACTKDTVKSSGLNIWSDEAGPPPEVDIIAVQGLGAHPYYTWVKKASASRGNEAKRSKDNAGFWRSKNSKEDQQGDSREDTSGGCMWFRDLVVPGFKNARVATYSYKSDWKDRAVKTSLRQCAEQFLNILSQHRQHATERRRPLVLIGHSLGGLVIQQALILAVLQQDFTDLRLSVAGIIFLGAPFQGSDVAGFGTWLVRLSGSDTTLLDLLKKNSQSLFDLSRDFWGSYSDWDLVCFYESIEAEYGPIKTQIVSSQSATLLGKRMMFLDTDHSGLNKFSGSDDQNFALVLPELRRMALGGASIVADRHCARDNGATHGNIHWMVPRAINNLFTGRTELIRKVRESLRNNQAIDSSKQRRFVITGLGGQGKSEICLKVASLMREEFWGIFWVNVDNPSTAESDFIAIAKVLGRSAETLPEALQVLASTKQNWLLILDNADDTDFDYQVYLPSSTHGALLMTSRVAECRRYSPNAFEALEGLEDQDCKDLLLKASEFPQGSWPYYESQATEVIRLLGSHTLALIQAGAYVAGGHCHLHQYPEVFQRQRKRLLEYRPNQALSRYCDIYTTFEASADVLKRSNSEDALILLDILSMLAPSVLLLDLFEEAWHYATLVPETDEVDSSSIDDMSQSHVSQLPHFMIADAKEWDHYRLSKAVFLLVSLSLVTQHDLGGTVGLSMHPLTYAWAKDRQGPEQQQKSWITAGCVLAFSGSSDSIWQKQGRLFLPHIESYLDMEVRKALWSGSKAIIAPVLLKCCEILENMRQDLRLKLLLREMLVELGQNPAKPSMEYLLLYYFQVRNLNDRGKIREAVALGEQMVKICETLAENHRDRLSCQHYLANAYIGNGQVEEAIALLEQVVKIQMTLAEDYPHALGLAYMKNGQVEEAIALLEHVVKTKMTLAEDHPSRLASQHVLGRAYKENGQVEEARELLEDVVEIERTKYPEGHPTRAVSERLLASLS